MAHIANKIDAKDKKLSEILYGQRYRVDSFQREYRWQRKHIEALISDLSISFLSNHQPNHTIGDSLNYDCYYMGPVVLCEDGGELSIVDGQQRLTSFTLLLIFLYHQQREVHTEDELRNLKDHLYVSKGGKKTLILNVESRKNVIEYLLTKPAELYENDNEEDDTQDESVVNIIRRYEDITLLFPEDLRHNDVLPIFIEWLLEKVILIEVKAYSMENAYTIFETMNDRGMTLSPTEILKGFLLSKIKEESKAEEANDFWKNRISKINRETKLDGDLDFFRAWLRAKYAITSREKKIGSENEDFELIATQFNSWVKNNTKKVHLSESKDFYFFIISDFDFYSDLYIRLYRYKNQPFEGYEALYISNFYPVADSLYYPLLLAPISKIDDDDIILEKANLVNKFLDIYTNLRTIAGKSITQSSIRYFMYDVIKDIRNLKPSELKSILRNKASELESRDDSYRDLHQMNNWGYYHYFLARILYNAIEGEVDFQDLMRSKKQSSYVMQRIFDESDFDENDTSSSVYLNAIANYCLIRRYHLDEFASKRSISTKLKFLNKNGYLVDFNKVNIDISSPIEFIEYRDSDLKIYSKSIWSF